MFDVDMKAEYEEYGTPPPTPITNGKNVRTLSYPALSNKPKINGVVLMFDITVPTITITNSQIDEITSD